MGHHASGRVSAARGLVYVALGLSVLIGLVKPALAHDVRPGAVALREVEPDRFALRLTPADDGGATPVLPAPIWPSGCTHEAEWVTCEAGLEGTLLIPQLADRRVKLGVFVTWLDGARFTRVLPEGEHLAEIERPIESGARGDIAGWLRLGAEHVVFGVDHVLFVWALLLVVGLRRALFGALIGFTAGHSLTLVAVSLGWISPPALVAETVIALSVLLLAVEAAKERPGSWTRERPWVVASLFGLVHGMGFAGSLLRLGLPDEGVLAALLAFNLGVELGQLIVLVPALLVGALAHRMAGPGQGARLALVYAVGASAAFWTIERLGRWLGVLSA